MNGERSDGEAASLHSIAQLHPRLYHYPLEEGYSGDGDVIEARVEWGETGTASAGAGSASWRCRRSRT
jgi:hypothetical protein